MVYNIVISPEVIFDIYIPECFVFSLENMTRFSRAKHIIDFGNIRVKQNRTPETSKISLGFDLAALSLANMM